MSDCKSAQQKIKELLQFIAAAPFLCRDTAFSEPEVNTAFGGPAVVITVHLFEVHVEHRVFIQVAFVTGAQVEDILIEVRRGQGDGVDVRSEIAREAAAVGDAAERGADLRRVC